MPPGGPISKDLQTALVSERLKKLDELLSPYRQNTAVKTRILVGTVFLEVVREVLREKYDLVIKSPDADDWLERLFGSSDMHLLRKCPCPVWMIKPQVKTKYRRILVALDLSNHPDDHRTFDNELNRQILELSSSLVLSEFAELHIVHAWQSINKTLINNVLVQSQEEDISAHIDQTLLAYKESLNALMHGVFEQLGSNTGAYLNPKIHLREGDASKEISNLAKELEADLVVMGTVARTGIPGFIMGNTAETILSQIDCSVIAIKPPGFVSPVMLEIE